MYVIKFAIKYSHFYKLVSRVIIYLKIAYETMEL